LAPWVAVPFIPALGWAAPKKEGGPGGCPIPRNMFGSEAEGESVTIRALSKTKVADGVSNPGGPVLKRDVEKCRMGNPGKNVEGVPKQTRTFCLFFQSKVRPKASEPAAGGGALVTPFYGLCGAFVAPKAVGGRGR